MENELRTVDGKKAVAVIGRNDLGDIIKPLIREIHLFDSFIAGTSHLDDGSILDKVMPGDTLALFRENNKFDENAILIRNEAGRKLGYVPEKDNIIFARLMDAGKILNAKVIANEKRGSFYKISIGIYLVDL